MWTKNIRNYCFVDTLHTAIIERMGAQWTHKQTRTHFEFGDFSIRFFRFTTQFCTNLLSSRNCYFFYALALSFLALSLCVVEPLLYFRTMSTITKTSCCNDNTLCIINTTPHHTRQRKYTLALNSECEKEKEKKWKENIRKNGCVQLYEMNAINRLRCDLNFIQSETNSMIKTHTQRSL